MSFYSMDENIQKQERATLYIRIDDGSVFVASSQYGRYYKSNLTKEALGC